MSLRWLLPLSLLMSGCSALSAFDAVVAKDKGSLLLARDLRYAPGRRGKLDVYAPRGTAAGARLPIIVWLYGGSWNSGSKDGYAFAARALAVQGFLVAVPDYRLVPEVRFPGFLEDNAAAVHWLRGHAVELGGDPDRIVLVGHSAGAYNAAMLSLDPQWLGADRAAVKGFAGLAGPYDFLPLDHAVTEAAFAQAPDLPATQPINFASPDDPPALLAAGGADELVLPANSVKLAMLLSEQGVAVRTRVYPKLGHVGLLTAFARPFRRTAPVLADVAAFARDVTRTD